MKQNSDSKTRVIVYTIFILMLGIFLAYGFIYKFPKLFQETVTKIEKDVTVTDYGIADAVDKVYDSVIIVSNYKNKELYASGSGFVYKEANDKFFIITNHHVIDGGDSFKVTYSDGEEVEAVKVGSDKFADIAVLAVPVKEGIKPVEIGTTEELRVGDTTFTVGAPLDFVYSWTVTRGIISGKERLVEVSINNSNDSDYVMNVLQTDAAVNSGNSGGPLCNSNGEVIGVISAKISSTGVEGMGFAIPIENAIEKAEGIINGDESEYPNIGIQYVNVSTALRSSDYYFSYYLRKNNVSSGVLVMDVTKNSAADKAGIKAMDVITKINNKEISNVAYLRYELYNKHDIGDTVKLTVIREGEEKVLSLKITNS